MPRRSSARKMMAQMIRRISNSRSGCSANTGDSGSLQANNNVNKDNKVGVHLREGRWCGGRGLDDGRRISADDRDHLVPFNLQAGVESHNDVVGENSRVRLKHPANIILNLQLAKYF